MQFLNYLSSRPRSGADQERANLKRELQRHIAIVDDDRLVCRALARFLAAHSFRVKCYASAPKVLKSLEVEIPGCLITDLQMRGMTGLELLYSLATTGLEIPTIVLTADDEPGLRHRCELAGAIFFLTKPVAGDVLLNAVKAVMERDRAHKSTVDE